jgi:hypothetical protein
VEGTGDRGAARTVSRRATASVQQLRVRLIDLAVALELDPGAARRSWQRGGRLELEEVLAVIDREMEANDRG